MQEVEVLSNNRSGWSREVERERVLDRAEVVKFKDEILGQVGFVAKDDPTNSDISEPKFMTTRVDRDDAGDFEIPFEFGL